jgi:hypothetical protein
MLASLPMDELAKRRGSGERVSHTGPFATFFRGRLFTNIAIVLLAIAVLGITAFGQIGYSISYVSASPKKGTRLTVGDHVVLNVTVKYDLRATDKGSIWLVLQKDDGSQLLPGKAQVSKEVIRGKGELTISDDFDVPAGTRSVQVIA